MMMTENELAQIENLTTQYLPSPLISFRTNVPKLIKEIRKLQSILFTIGEIAVSNFEDHIVGLVDRTLPKGFKISEEEHNQNLELLKKKKNES